MIKSKKEFIDNTYFLGMHSKNNKIRVFCKNYFVSKFDKIIYISQENIWKIDNIIWSFPKASQEAYFPFMDRLMTDMNIWKLWYTNKDLDIYNNLTNNLLTNQKLTLAQVISNEWRLFTLDEDLLNLELKYIYEIDRSLLRSEQSFPEEIEILYKRSLKILF